MSAVAKLALLLALTSCSAALDEALLGRTMLTFSEAHGVIELTPEQCASCAYGRRFAIVQPAQLPRVRKASSLTYLGTQNGFHFFMTWNKVVKEGEVANVALRLDDCAVTRPSSIDSESAAHRLLRSSGGRCAVP